MREARLCHTTLEPVPHPNHPLTGTQGQAEHGLVIAQVLGRKASQNLAELCTETEILNAQMTAISLLFQCYNPMSYKLKRN